MKSIKNSKLIISEAHASITVEAAYLMPIVIITIFALIYLSFILHDKCLIQGEVDKVLHKASFNVKHEADLITGAVEFEKLDERGIFYFIFGSTQDEENRLKEYLKKELSEGLFLMKITSAEIEVNKFDINIQIEAKANITLPVFHNLLNRYSGILITNSCVIHNPAETIRAAEVILETGSSIKGMDELKEKLDIQ
ncbi:MAG TPA: TadE family protein [Mobilitalea sp.]|nr:TadE family protein [Mobilitalea sp.]